MNSVHDLDPICFFAQLGEFGHVVTVNALRLMVNLNQTIEK